MHFVLGIKADQINMPLRMQRYANELWLHMLAMMEHFVVSMVLYTGNCEYSYANSLRSAMRPIIGNKNILLHRFQLICSQNVLHKVEGAKYP